MRKRVLGLTCVLALMVGALPLMAQWGGGQQQSQLPTRPPDDQNVRPDAIPEGTTFTIRLRDTIDTRKMKRGDHFQGEIQEDLVTANELVIPRGRRVQGHIGEIYRGLHDSVILSFEKIETRHGWVPLAATVIGVPGEHSVNQTTGAEGEINRSTDKKRTIESAAVGAAVGAATGAIMGGGKGAAIGAAVGAGAGGGAGILTDRNLRIEKGQAVELRLDRPIIVPSH